MLKRLDVSADVNIEKAVCTVGTIFWARTKSLHKLFNYGWDYSSFPEEPLPNDGTISHAIERCLCFVAKDAGYDSGTIMTQKYAVEYLLGAQDMMRVMYSCLNKELHVNNFEQVKTLYNRISRIEEYISQKDKVYIYGAGQYGRSLYKCIKHFDMDIDGFIVTEGIDNKIILGKPVFKICEINIYEGVGIIIGVSNDKTNEIVQVLKKKNYYGYIDGYGMN